METRETVLRILAKGPNYALGMRDAEPELTDPFLYTVLRNMEADGLLRSWEGEATPERGMRPKAMYELTTAGREALDALPAGALAVAK